MNKKILKLAFPNILSNITIPLLGLVDTALMGHLDNVAFLGAIALGSMIFNIVYWSLGFLRMGTVGFTAQAFGANSQKGLNFILQRGILLASILGLIIIALHPWIIELGIQLTQSSDEVKFFAAEYINIRIWAAPASLLILVFSGWFLGMQNAIYPMIIAIVGNVLNIIFSFIFVYFMHMNSAGAALGTLISQYLSLLVALALFMYKYKHIWKKVGLKALVKLQELKPFFNVNKDIFIRTLGIIFVISFFTIKSANISDNILAVNSILFQLFLLFSFMLDGFANAAEAMTGEYIGARNLKLLKESVKKNMTFGLIFSILFSITYFFAGDFILRIMTNNETIIQLANELMPWIVIMPLVSFTAFIYDGIFIGATASKALRNAMIIAVVGVFIPLYYFIALDDLIRLWISFLSFMAARGLGLFLLMNKSVYSLIPIKSA